MISFLKVCINVLDEHGPGKKKCFCGNRKPFQTNTSFLENNAKDQIKERFRKYSKAENMKFYSKQGNLYIFLLRKEKRQYFLRILLKTERQGIRDLSKGLALFFLIDLSVEKDYFGCKICFFGMTHFQILSKSFRDTRLSPRKCTSSRVFYLTYAKLL